jgi:hypothetical protein
VQENIQHISVQSLGDTLPHAFTSASSAAQVAASMRPASAGGACGKNALTCASGPLCAITADRTPDAPPQQQQQLGCVFSTRFACVSPKVGMAP